MRRLLSFVAAAALVAGAGCGEGEEDGDRGDAAPPQAPAQGCPAAAALGSIEPSPVVAAAGETVRLPIVNRSGRQMTFGVAYGFQRREGQRWVDATEQVYGGMMVFPELAVVVEPGERHSGSYAAVELARDLAAGRYRALKDVTLSPEGGGGGSAQGRLCGAFTVG